MGNEQERLLQVNEEIGRLCQSTNKEDIELLVALREEQLYLEYSLGDDVMGLQGYRGGPA